MDSGSGETSVGQQNYLPEVMAGVFVLFFIALGISPSDRAVWIVECSSVILVFALLVWTVRYFRFSTVAYMLMGVWLFLHTIGGHYTFEKVPFGFVTDLFGFERNHFDRFAHFCIGFYAYPVAEFLVRKKYAGKTVACFFALFSVMAMAAGWEIVEWWYAVVDGGEVGAAFLGSQGDIWDAQKDMLCDTLGAMTALTFFVFLTKPRRR